MQRKSRGFTLVEIAIVLVIIALLLGGTLKGQELINSAKIRNLANDIPGEVVSTLLGVCVEEAPVFQRYFARKAGWLGTDRLRRFDLYAPVSGKAERRIPFDEAVATVMEGFTRFSSEAATLVSDSRESGRRPQGIRRRVSRHSIHVPLWKSTARA